jgi:Electron transfer DM13
MRAYTTQRLMQCLGVSALLMTLLAGCGGGDSTSAATATSAAATPAVAPTAGTATSPPPAAGTNSAAAAPPAATATAPVGTACTKLSPRIGQVATLQTRAHGVSGQAKVIDDCTIEIDNFNYDGGGLPDVFVYGAKAGDYARGFALGSNLFGKAVSNGKVVITLKSDDLAMLDGVSIWCVRAGVSFGDGLFATP